MFVVEVSYIKPISEIDQQLTAHREFLDKYYAKDIFLASGAKVPREGGIILAHKLSRSELENILKEDPFHIHGLAQYRIVEFQITKKNPQFPF